MLEQRLLFPGCSNIQFFKFIPFPKHSQSGHPWYPITHCAVLVCIMGCHTAPLVTKYPKDEPLPSFLAYWKPV